MNIILILVIFFSQQVQPSLSGVYDDGGGTTLNLLPNKSYEQRSILHGHKFWENGRWKFENDTLVLINTPIYDVVKKADGEHRILSNGASPDKMSEKHKSKSSPLGKQEQQIMTRKFILGQDVLIEIETFKTLKIDARTKAQFNRNYPTRFRKLK